MTTNDELIAEVARLKNALDAARYCATVERGCLAGIWNVVRRGDGYPGESLVEIVTDYVKRAETAEAKLTSPPAPSGWQQRIAAMDPWVVGEMSETRCYFCGITAFRIEPKHEADCLWQNAKDALPPAPEGTVASRSDLFVAGLETGRVLERMEADAPPKEPRG